MIYTKRDQRCSEEREIITNFFTPIRMSIWNRSDLQPTSQDYSNSKFLSKRLGDGESATLTFIDVLHKIQAEDTPEQFKTEDGYQFVFYFNDDAGKEIEMAQNSARGKFFSAMRASLIEPNTLVTITRRGTGMETEWDIVKAGEQPLEPNVVAPF
jgi:hypothetical protein